MTDLLTASAQAYHDLMGVQYRLRLGKNERMYTVYIGFPADGYHHLAGFQYADGIMALRNKQEALHNVLCGMVTDEMLIKAGHYEKIKNRLSAICQIEILMQENRFVFYYNGRGPARSRIIARYLIMYPMQQDAVHFFVNGDGDRLVPASIFIADYGRYVQGSAKLTTLEIVKVFDGRETVLYRSAHYLPPEKT